MSTSSPFDDATHLLRAEAVQHLFVFDNPRTCSQLFHAFFKGHPQLAHLTAHWCVTAATAGPERLQLSLRQGDAARQADKLLHQQHEDFFKNLLNMDVNQETYDTAAQRLSESFAAAEQQVSGSIRLYRLGTYLCVLGTEIFCQRAHHLFLTTQCSTRTLARRFGQRLPEESDLHPRRHILRHQTACLSHSPSRIGHSVVLACTATVFCSRHQ